MAELCRTGRDAPMAELYFVKDAPMAELCDTGRDAPMAELYFVKDAPQWLSCVTLVGMRLWPSCIL